MALSPCRVCQIPLGHREVCPSPSCPCYGMRSDSAEAEAAATRWRSRPSVAANRTWDGDDALEHLNRQARLYLQEQRSETIDILIEHRSL